MKGRSMKVRVLALAAMMLLVCSIGATQPPPPPPATSYVFTNSDGIFNFAGGQVSHLWPTYYDASQAGTLNNRQFFSYTVHLVGPISIGGLNAQEYVSQDNTMYFAVSNDPTGNVATTGTVEGAAFNGVPLDVYKLWYSQTPSPGAADFTQWKTPTCTSKYSLHKSFATPPTMYDKKATKPLTTY
jgi:hypothetical protein